LPELPGGASIRRMTATDPLANTASLQERAHRHLLMHFTRNGAFGPGGTPLLVLERGEGAYVFDTEGRRYLDGLSSLFCCQLGYSFGEEMAAAAAKQLTTLAFNTNWATAHPPAIELAEALAERAPGDLNRAFFTSGGSESVEAAWKILRQYYLARGEPQRTKAIAREIAYHGVTLGALSFTGVRPMKEPFGQAPIPVVRVSNTNAYRAPEGDDPAALCTRLLDEMERAIVEAGPETVAMIIAEPVQNAGGCLVPPDGYWPGLRELADRYGIALVADEVITGFGRIGEWFAASRYGGTPDLITLAKGITSAYAPMGAVMVSDRIAEPLYEEGRMLLHGITFGGHPVAAAMALRNIEVFEREGVLENVRANEGHLGERLGELGERLPIVGDVRGAGYFWALELVRDEEGSRFSAEERERLLRGFLSRRLLEEGLIARPDDRGDAVLHLAPPLICGRPELDELVAKTEAVLADASERFFAG
jgi:adenosylmethionine-8-amino-7-oxononanoate aminotransferase